MADVVALQKKSAFKKCAPGLFENAMPCLGRRGVEIGFHYTGRSSRHLESGNSAPRPGILLIQLRIDFISGVSVVRSWLLDFLGFEGEKHEQGRSYPSVLH
jgi:hypothetical protein